MKTLYDGGLSVIAFWLAAGWCVSHFHLVEGAVEAAKNSI